MKDLNPTTSIPRSANLSRFRPLSLPVYLDYKAPKRHVSASGDSPPSPLQSISPKTPSGFHISGIPRMLRPGARTTLLSKPSASLDYHPKQNESRCCQMLIHGLYVAFEDDFVDSGVPRNEDLLADAGRPFTHFISLSTRHKTPIRHSVDRNGTQRLRLQLPQLYDRTPPSAEALDAKVLAARDAAVLRGDLFTPDDALNIIFDEGGDTRFTGLDALQLTAARDFLCGANIPSGPSDRTNAMVRVLVTTPRDHRTDAIASVLGYLSMVYRRSVQEILQVQDNHPKILTIWKNTISEECAEFIEDVCHL